MSLERARQIDHSVLDKALLRARAAGPGGVVVFDLDSTLLDNRPRQAAILAEFGRTAGLAALERAQPEHWQGWSIQRAMLNAGLTEDEVERIAEQAKQFWRERFFTSEYCRLDRAVPGAVEFVREIRARGTQVAYFTGRHEAMRAGTLACFQTVGLPAAGPLVHLFMKPTFEMSDDDWKLSAFEHLRALGDVLAVFDNEPTHVNGYRAAFPSALVVHIATDDSGRPVALADGIPSVRDFVRGKSAG